MKGEPLVPFSISLPRRVKDLLRKMAAERNLKQPEEDASAAGLAREILCDLLNGVAQDVTGSQRVLTTTLNRSSDSRDHDEPNVHNRGGYQQ